jgi:uncharacterized protein (DUF1778 family)
MLGLQTEATPFIVEVMGGDKGDKGKRDRQLNVRLTGDDITLMTRAAGVAWPGAILSTSSIMLSLARLKAEEILKSPRKRG